MNKSLFQTRKQFRKNPELENTVQVVSVACTRIDQDKKDLDSPETLDNHVSTAAW